MILSSPSPSGASLFLGMIPGSLDDVKKRNVNSCEEEKVKRCRRGNIACEASNC